MKRIFIILISFIVLMVSAMLIWEGIKPDRRGDETTTLKDGEGKKSLEIEKLIEELSKLPLKNERETSLQTSPQGDNELQVEPPSSEVYPEEKSETGEVHPEKTEMESSEPPPEKPQGRPYPKYRGWPDTPENRALLAKFDQNCEYGNKVLLPLMTKLNKAINELLDRYFNKKEISSDEFGRMHRLLTKRLNEVQQEFIALDEECRRIMEKLRASRREYEELSTR